MVIPSWKPYAAMALLGIALAGVFVGFARAEKLQLIEYGPAPEFTGLENWINSAPLTMNSLRGKVVLVDFWTFACVNCVRTLPHITKWYEKYKDYGLVVVGVHTPEFAYERQARNVAAAVKRLNIAYPVAQDNRYTTWRAYDTQYWPTSYLVDKRGVIVLKHIGEGNYDEMEQAIRGLLGLQSAQGK